MKGKRLSSGSFFDASLDPFADDDGFVVGKGRKRTKFARHSDSWRLLDRTPSPEKETINLQSDQFKESAETAISPSPPQTVPNDDDDVEILDERHVERGQLKSTPGSPPTASSETHPPSYLSESPSDQVGTETSGAAQSADAVQHEAGQMQPPAMPPRRPPTVLDIGTNSVAGHETQSPARSDLETPRLGPLPSPGLPLISPLIRRSGLNTGYFPDTEDSRSELDASGDRQQSVTTAGVRLAPNPPSTFSPDVEQFPLHSSIELNMTHTLESEVAIGDALFETSSPAPDVSQFDQSFQPMSWPLSYEEVRQPLIVPFEQQQASSGGKGSDFEFLNTSPIEPYHTGQNTWSHLETPTPASTEARLQAPNDGGLSALADASIPPSDVPLEVSHETSQHNNQNSSTAYEVAKPDLTATHVGESAQTENYTGVPGHPPDSSQRVPIDPNLLKSLEEGAELFTSGKENALVAGELPEEVSDARPWSDKLDISAVDAESQQVYYAPPIPFQQRWHRRSSDQRSRRSSQYASIDGASDGVSADESSDGKDMLDGSHRLETFDHEKRSDNGVESSTDASTSNPALPLPRDNGSRDEGIQISGKDEDLSNIPAPGGPPNVVILDSSDEDSTSGERPEGTVKDGIAISAVGVAEETLELKSGQIVDSGNETRLRTKEMQELMTDRIEDPALLPDSDHDEPPSPAINTAAAGKTEGGQTETSPIRRQYLVEESSRPPAEPTNSIQLLGELPNQKLRYQLVTPDSTQQGRGDSQLQEPTAELSREIPLPPTPQNTQEYADIPQPTAELPISADVENEVSQTPKMSLPGGVNEAYNRRRSPRLSRKLPPSQEVAEVVSPYFTPRRSSQMRPQDQLTTPHKLTLVEPTQAPAKDTTQIAEKEKKLKSITPSNEEVAPGSPLQAQPKAGLTTSLSYYTPLSRLQDHFANSVDILALSTTASTEPQKAKSGPKDWHTTLHLTEASLRGSKTITAQIFRSYKTALPMVQRGNVVLLRSFKVQSQKRKCMLLSTESSAWAVFSVHKKRGREVSNSDVLVVGPPVEYGFEEMSYAAELKKWWEVEGEGQHPGQKHAGQTSKAVPAAESGNGGEVIHQLRDGTIYQDHNDSDKPTDVSGPYHELRDGTIYQDDTVGKASQSDRNSGELHTERDDPQPIHQLRDGTVYQDGTPTRAPRNGRSNNSGIKKGPSHAEDVKATEEADEGNEIKDFNRELEPIDLNVKAEADSGDESPTDQAVSSQIYHELRNGRRYADPAPLQQHVDEPPRQGEENEDESVIHELRDGVTYVDE